MLLSNLSNPSLQDMYTDVPISTYHDPDTTTEKGQTGSGVGAWRQIVNSVLEVLSSSYP